MTAFSCPCCQSALLREGNVYSCRQGHSFDIAAAGYVNLLCNSASHNHGDDKPMVRARRDFLNRGYYQKLADAVLQTVGESLSDGGVLLDAGCGECYYTAALFDFLVASGKKCTIAGIDISKNALLLGAKRFPGGLLCVGSVYKMPFFAEEFDMVLSMFAPYCEEEFLRVLKKGGVLCRVVPNEKHLYSLKKAIYDRPYENEANSPVGDSFLPEKQLRVAERICLTCSEDIQNLFSMTPYYHKTGEKDRSKLSALDSLETEIDFSISTYRKK